MNACNLQQRPNKPKFYFRNSIYKVPTVYEPYPASRPSTRSCVVPRAYTTSPQGPSSPWPRQTSTIESPATTTATTLPSPSYSPTTSTIHQISRLPQGFVSEKFPRHPLDDQNTMLLRALPGLELIARGLLGPAAEQVLILENIGTAVQVGSDQIPSLHHLLCMAADILQMERPDLFVKQDPNPNAYTLAISGRKPFIVIHTALVELLTPAELQAVLAHELGHLKCDHGTYLTAANLLALGAATLLPGLSAAVEEALLRWLRAAELSCDRASLLVTQDAKVVVSALMKLAGGSPKLAQELNIEAFLRQARSYDEATATPLGWYLRNAQTRGLSHPLPVLRAREIDRWAKSDQYRRLLVSTEGKSSGGRGGSSFSSSSSSQVVPVR